MVEAQDFLDECNDIYALIKDLSAEQLAQPTLFKNWTINDIIAHLHLWNMAANYTAFAPDKFDALAGFAMAKMGEGVGHVDMQNAYLDGLSGPDLIAQWKAFYGPMAARFATAEPERRVRWVGPDMSMRSCIIARQMEQWAHAQAVYDVLDTARVNTDRLKNIAHIGVTTYSWSFRVNGLQPPAPKPYVRLTAPSGTDWEWNAPQDDNRIEGTAEQFCKVVTQCRNIADTALVLTGKTAQDWMAMAQCFAGGAETPPAKGARRRG